MTLFHDISAAKQIYHVFVISFDFHLIFTINLDFYVVIAPLCGHRPTLFVKYLVNIPIFVLLKFK